MTRKEFLKNFAALGLGSPFIATLFSWFFFQNIWDNSKTFQVVKSTHSKDSFNPNKALNIDRI